MGNLRIDMKKTTLLISLIALSLQCAMAGGGWTSGKGKGYFKLGQSIIVADHYFTPSGDVVPITTIGQYSTFFYGEYGLTDKLDLVAYAPFFSRVTLNQRTDVNGQVITPGDQLNSFGDTDISLKYGVISGKPLVVSATLTLGLPLGVAGGGDTGILQTGDGEFNQMLRLDVSRSFNKFYSSAYLGYNHRTNNFNDEIRYGLEGGMAVSKWYFILRFFGIKPLESNKAIDVIPFNGIFGNKIEYLSFTPEVIYQVNDRMGFSVAFGGAFYAKRILAAPNLTGGFYIKL
jgi:hypothetical protein